MKTSIEREASDLDAKGDIKPNTINYCRDFICDYSTISDAICKYTRFPESCKHIISNMSPFEL